MTKKRKLAKGSRVIKFPAKVLSPAGSFLRSQLRRLKKRKREIEKDDPFKNVNRITDNASPDADAEEQFGHARSTAVKDQLERKIVQTRKALARVKIGKYGICEECGDLINTDRLMVYPEATLCIKCESKKPKNNS
jgi:RNA polymerase-binding transcription factor DksA